MSWLIGLAVAAISTASDGAIPLKRGLFVDHRERCGGGHGYLYSAFDGENITSEATQVSEKLKRVSAVEYTGDYRASDGTLTRDKFVIKSPTRFSWSTRYGIFYLKYCPNASLPKEWRNPRNSN